MPNKKQSSSFDAKTISGTMPLQMNGVSAEFKATIENETDEFVKVKIIAAVGDIFFQNVFMPEEAVRTSASNWDGTWHDISHLATMYPAGFSFIENLDYLLGYNTEVEYNPQTKALSMSSYIRKDAPKYGAWRNYMEICKASGKIPNVSIFSMAKYQAIKASDLPNGVAIPQGANVNGYVLAIKSLEPFAVTTCLLGKCDDTKGCGIKTNQNLDDVHGVDTNETDVTNTDTDDNSEKKKHYLKRIKQLKKGD